MAQRNGSRIVQEVPGVDGLLGTRRWMEIVPFIQALRESKPGFSNAKGRAARSAAQVSDASRRRA